MAIVEDFYLGATHVQIDDSCVVKTQEEVDAILDKIADIWTAHLQRERAKLEKENQKNTINFNSHVRVGHD
ncbi:MAG: hypothetical protein LUG94_07010 [Ruminococcus sp.]|nr:hypothetical protein [Ruminococcus sp.]